jgi:hypothetical protein
MKETIKMVFFILASDFNMVLAQEEKCGGSYVCNLFKKKVEDIMANWDLIDVKPRRGKYTWLNKKVSQGHIVEDWIDFFLMDVFWKKI